MTKSGGNPNCITAALLAAGLMGTWGACAKSHNKQAEMAKRAENASGQVAYGDSVSATVEAVDREHRTVTLREPAGDVYTVAVGDGVALDRVQPEDKVNVAYQEALDFAVQPPGDKPKMGEEATAERLPNGVQYGRRVTTTVEILAVAPKGEAATFRNQDGDVRTVEVDNPANREKVSHLRPGDNVEVTYTEKLALQLEK
jgi:hypothetical protein